MPEIDGRVILLIVFVAISAIKWLMEKIQGADQADPEEESNDNMESLYEQYREEIRQRQTKLQKKAATETPPPLPPVATSSGQSAQRRQIRKPQEPSLQSLQSPPQQSSRAKPAPSYTPKKTIVSAEQMAAASRFEQHSSSQRKPSAQTYVRALLSNPETTRQAIILSEILGKPKSIQSR